MNLVSTPESWLEKKLDDVASVRTGDGAPQESSAFSDQGIPFVRAGSLSFLLTGGTEVELERIDPKEVQRRRMTIFPSGTVVFAKSGMSCTKGHIYQLKEPCCVVNHLAAIECSKSIDSRFLVRWFERTSPARLIENESYPSIKISAIRDLEIPLPHKNGKPDLDEQKRIAAILDKADDIRRKRQQALRLTDDFLRSVFLDLFGDPVRNPKGWAEDELKNLGKVSTGSTPPSKKDAMFGGEIPFVTPGDLSEGPVSSRRTVTTEGAKNSRTVRPGATFVCCIGATIGKMGKAATRSAFNQQINAVEWNGRIADDYGLEVLKFFKGIIASRGSSTTLPILNKSAFQSLVIPVPPRRLQDKFSETITSLSRFRSRQESVDSYGADFFAALQQRAFRGEL